MSFEALRESIETRFATQWGATTPVSYTNLPFTPPSGSWVRLAVLPGQGQTWGITGTAGYVRDTGVIAVQVFVSTDQGTKAAMDLVDLITPIFEHKRFDGILTRTASVNVVGPSDGWLQINVTIPFRRIRDV